MSIKKDNEMMARLYTEARVDFDPDKMKFSDPIPEEGDMSNVSVRKEEYSWGALVVIEKGHDFSIVLHPEQQKQVRELKAGDKAVFKDETGTQYTVSRGDGLYNFVGDNGTKLSVDDRDLTRKLWSDIGFGEGDVEDEEGSDDQSGTELDEFMDRIPQSVTREDEEGGVIPDDVKDEIRNYLEGKAREAEEKNRGYQERGENSWVGVPAVEGIMDDLERFNPGINSLDDYLNWEDYQTYYDVYKDHHGISPRWTNWKDSDDWDGEISKLNDEFKDEIEKGRGETQLEIEYFGKAHGAGDIPTEPNKKFREFARAAGEQGLYNDYLPDFISYRLRDPKMEKEMEAAWQDNYRMGQRGGSAMPNFDNSVAQALQSAGVKDEV